MTLRVMASVYLFMAAFWFAWIVFPPTRARQARIDKLNRQARECGEPAWITIIFKIAVASMWPLFVLFNIFHVE